MLLSGSALYGQIEINDNLSVTGFLDMSLFHADTDDGDSTSFDLDQMELDFIFSFDQISGQVDIDYQRDDANEIDLEQAFITYDFGEGSSVTAGKFLSYHGWETAEPTGLYQYSYAYEIFATIPGYHNGITYDYSGDWGSFGVAFLDTVFGDDGSINGGGDAFEYGFETKLVLTPADGWTFYLGYALDSGEGLVEDAELINFWTSYEVDSHTFAFEYNIYDQGNGFEFADLSWGIDVDQWLLMYSLAATDSGTFTARVSNESGDAVLDGGTTTAELELDKYTVSWIEAVNDNLALVFEYSKVDSDAIGDSDNFAIEALFTF